MIILYILLFFSDLVSSPATIENPPNILWIVAEDISPMLGCYGDEYATTPNLDSFAKKAVLYRKAYATAPICAPARSCLITGMYATALGTQHLRTEVEKPDYIQTFPEHLKRNGYFTTNNGKTDFNFDPSGVWDFWQQDNAPWRHRPKGQPFFSMINLGMTHEGPGNHQERHAELTTDLPKHLFHDPSKVTVPPYYPDTKETREIWARYADLITVMDRTVGEILRNLEEDGLTDNTIVFFFSDHGHGLPRYKRWLNETGLHVPLIIYVPPKYQHLLPQQPGTENTELVSFVDFAPSVLHLADVPIPDNMQGQPFLGRMIPQPRSHIFAARSRADDMYEISRAVRNDRYLYVRHYLPHLPYIQSGVIFDDRKDSFRELRRLHESRELPEEAEKMWHSKPVEEFYDLQNDPQELRNLAQDAAYDSIKQKLRQELHRWILTHRDVGFLAEPEGWIRAKAEGTTIYEMAQDEQLYDLPTILQAAEQVGKADAATLTLLLQNEDSGVRFWGATGLLNLGEEARPALSALKGALTDPSPSVQLVAAEAVCQLGNCEQAYPVLTRWVTDERPWLALQAARTIEQLGERAKPLVPTMRYVMEQNLAEPGSARKYKDFNFASFTGWALEAALEHSGVKVE